MFCRSTPFSRSPRVRLLMCQEEDHGKPRSAVGSPTPHTFQQGYVTAQIGTKLWISQEYSDER